MNYKDFTLGDWIGHISGVIEDETTLDGNEMRDLVEFLTTLEQEPTEPLVEIDLYSVIKQKYIERDVLDKIRADIINYESDCRLSVDEYPLCKECNDKVFETIYGILDKYKTESEEK